MVKCSQCGENRSFFHYLYDGTSKLFVNFPTCRKCFNEAKAKPKTEDDIYYSDELALFKIEELTKRVKKLEQEVFKNERPQARKSD